MDKRKVLIIEDEIVPIAKFLKLNLEKEGYEVDFNLMECGFNKALLRGLISVLM